jgi:hypothetical protein
MTIERPEPMATVRRLFVANTIEKWRFERIEDFDPFKSTVPGQLGATQSVEINFDWAAINFVRPRIKVCYDETKEKETFVTHNRIFPRERFHYSAHFGFGIF